ncbi:alpha/beta hydrolase [Eubacteriaceae bacterium ES3]|nr:alpha/beta hydrolase [Eubacteriaceae bacterium ES3]
MKVQCGYTETEGDELFYKVRGQGLPILFIAPGGGDGDNYLPVADILAEDYKVITYDRRANARSSRHSPDQFSIAQQSRDAIAVLNAVGEKTAFVVGNSSSAVIALDLVTNFPGHHASFMDQPTEWATCLINILKRFDENGLE